MSERKGHEVLRNPWAFTNAVHAFAQVQIHYAEGAPAILYCSVSDDVRKHVGMLDSMAILIAIGQEKVVTTGLIRETGVTQIVARVLARRGDHFNAIRTGHCHR